MSPDKDKTLTRAFLERVMRGVSNSNLPPSIEGAYYKKSIELKRRIEEIEANNDKKRVTLERINRDVQKLRLERALLIDMVKRGMSAASPTSDKSDSPPPTVRFPPWTFSVMCLILFSS